MANQTRLPEISHYITSYDPSGKSTFLAAPNPPLVQMNDPSMRVDYIYSTVGSATGPVLTDLVDYKNNQDVRNTTPHIMFPLAGGSSAVVASFEPNPDPDNDTGFMHRSNTLDYVFIIDGELELTLDSGEKRVMKRGDVCVQRASQHSWKNLSKTEIARFGAVTLGIEGAKLNEMIFPGE
ncbi:uncharacterized protein LY89DRAFT_780332 [Mollisia scopiformis]|uniref:Cupin 2 conserved barrel domain-containing protein n=1 Tax=Mollisia scopiformis TaxID=149040 RepID=A0A194XGX0_MOLSC|nr:uncharacterized protein LY89DRAFT_780332 [Mollisia scopiformis]KUJ19386.1 hypothetical protein LY89DRAFT_780332 [Mollisia scopiformis]